MFRFFFKKIKKFKLAFLSCRGLDPPPAPPPLAKCPAKNASFFFTCSPHAYP